MPKLFITTPIYYSSGKPHIGHAYTTILADVIARYKRAIGYDVLFLTGMDEHGQKIENTAKKNNKNVQTMLDEISTIFQQLWVKLNIKYDCFVRTTNTKHVEAVKKVFSNLWERNFLYLDNWHGYYCINCEENYSLDQIVKKDDKLFCKVGHEISLRNEESYFLKISLFKDWIKQQIKKVGFIIPENRVNELLNSFINVGLEDLSVTRTSFDWGIKVNQNPKHIIYVWIDALMSYLTGLGYLTDNDALFKKYWNANDCQRVHLMSKEITRFHCIYWPILLKMQDLKLPDKIISHGWIITKTGKMSKSLGNVIDPNIYVEKYGSDALRYFLISQTSYERDSIFSDELFINTINSHLANNYGNLFSRISTMIFKYCHGLVPKLNEKTLNDLDKKILKERANIINKYKILIENFDITGLVNLLQSQYSNINKYIDTTQPWSLAKDVNNIDKLFNVLNISFNCMLDLMILLSPILVKTTLAIEQALNISISFANLNKDWYNLKLVNIPPLFIRINKK